MTCQYKLWYLQKWVWCGQIFHKPSFIKIDMHHYNNAAAGDITHTMEGKPSQGNDKVIGIAHGVWRRGGGIDDITYQY